MRTKQEIIIQYYREGKSQRKISRDLGIHRKTVKSYIDEYESKRLALEVPEVVQDSFVENLVRVPKYESKNRQKRKLTRELSLRLEELYKQNEEKRRQGLHKQRMKKIDIYELVCEEGFEISYTTVCNYLRILAQKQSEAYIKQCYEPGSVCEFDWAEVKLIIAGKRYRVMLAVFTAAMSNYRWAKLFWRQDTSSFQQAHVDYFSQIGGVFQCMVYDNMRVAIRRFTVGGGKEPTESFLQLSTYYQFRWRFCNAGRGNEKGHVERDVEYIRRKGFSIKDEFESLAQANAHLLAIVEGLNIRPLQGKQKSGGDLFEEEKPYLYACPPAFDCAELLRCGVDKYSTICCGTNHYSVPDHLVSKRLDVRLYPIKVLVFWQGKQVCCHERRTGQYGWYIKLEHYLYTLERKPGAVAGSVALRSADECLRRLYEAHFTHQPKAFIQLLQYKSQKQKTLSQIQEAVEKCLLSCPHRPLSLDKIKVLCENVPDPLIKADQNREDAIEQASKRQLEQLALLLSNQKSIES